MIIALAHAFKFALQTKARSLIRYGLRALRQAPRLLCMYAPVKFALRANFYVA